MDIVTSQMNVEFFSFAKMMSDRELKGWKPNVLPNILLSRVPNISNDIIAEFEQMNIYDLEDLINSKKILQQNRKVDYINFEQIKEKAIVSSFKQHSIPVVSISLPENYAIVSLIENLNSISLALSWKSLLLIWKDVKLLRLEEFINEFEKFLEYLGFPELITDVRSWNVNLMGNLEPSDVSVYLSNFDMFSPLKQYCKKLDQPNLNHSIESGPLLDQLFQIEYILWIAKINNN
jgi:hypothetical protein